MMEKILFEYDDFEGNYAIESAWAERTDNGYKLCNILFYATQCSWGDIVKVENRNGERYVIDLVEESGHSTVRIIFHYEDCIQATMKELENMECSWEGGNVSILFSVDIPPDVDYYKVVKPFLSKGEAGDLWGYEESCLAHKI